MGNEKTVIKLRGSKFWSCFSFTQVLGTRLLKDDAQAFFFHQLQVSKEKGWTN